MNKRILIGTTLTTMLVVCSCMDEPFSVPSNRMPISFEAEVGMKSRGTTTDMTALRENGFDVYALIKKEGGISADSLYFAPTTYTYSNASGKWVGLTHFWPGGENSLDMFFYAPSNAFDSIHYTSHEAFFSVSPSISLQRDLLWAPPMTGLTSSTATVTPHFAHALSRIVLTAYIDGTSLTVASGGVKVNSVVLSGEFCTHGTLNLGAQSTNNLWKSVTTVPTDYSPAIRNTTITTTDSNAPVSLLQDGQELFVIPTNFADNKCKITVTFAEGGKTYTIIQEINVNFEAGQTYTINMRLSKQADSTAPDITTQPSDPDEDNL